MSIWKTQYGWRYQFMFHRKEYSKSGFKTKALAKAAEAARQAELKKAAKAKTKTGMVFSELANEYLDYAERRFAAKTYKYKAYVLRSFLDYSGDIPISGITISLLESYLRTRKTNINYNRHRKDLCALLTYAWRRKLIEENPCFFLEKMPEPKFFRQIPTPEEMARLLLAAGEDRPLILVLCQTLARIDEVLRLRWQDVNFQEKTITLHTRKRKGGSWAANIVPMNQVLYDTLWGLWRSREQAEWVFFNAKTGTRYNRRPKLMHTLCKRAMIPYFGFHAIRHFISSLLHDHLKISVASVGHLLGHQSKETTERYLQVIEPTSRAAVEALADFFLTKFPQATTSTEIQ